MKIVVSAHGTNIANYFLRYHTMQSCGSGGTPLGSGKVIFDFYKYVTPLESLSVKICFIRIIAFSYTTGISYSDSKKPLKLSVTAIFIINKKSSIPEGLHMYSKQIKQKNDSIGVEYHTPICYSINLKGSSHKRH
jgi:hypothetical protein